MSELGAFLRTSVVEGTSRGYDRHWEDWVSFLRDKVNGQDPWLRDRGEEDKACLVALFLKERHDRGLRGRAATAASAAIRLALTSALESTSHLDDPVVRAARAACERTTAEEREHRNGEAVGSTKLPVCESMLSGQREALWDAKSWLYPDIDSRALYLAKMWAFDQGARVGEYTAAEKGCEDHCIRAGDLHFDFEDGDVCIAVRGGEGYFAQVRSGEVARRRALGCWVRPITQKTGKRVKEKLIARRHEGEERLLDDLVEWFTHSGVGPEDELFSRYAMVRGRMTLKRLWPRNVRKGVKDACVEAGLDPRFFSAHSLRKASQTHMSAMGASMSDRLDRGGYAEGSMVPSTTYDYNAAGHGALSSSSIAGGKAPGVEDVRRYLPTAARGNLRSSGGRCSQVDPRGDLVPEPCNPEGGSNAGTV